MPALRPAQPGPNTFFFADYRPAWGDNFNQIEYTAHLTFDKDPEGKDFITIDAITCDAGFDLDNLLDDEEISPEMFSAVFDYAASLFIPDDDA
jgi:hypothetical protein